ncbi:Rho-related protein racC [Toxocara canis]|uniref:Rho-related protein racC n=1 Tax=Toxocara canis TaxID=6265 RepID=A0A0B2V0J5_TOXCA|nr:Rho-related protein racC [Toxocara canis]
MSDNQVSIRCVVVGDNGVGKSTLIQSYVNNKFIENLEEITDMPIVEKLRSELYVGVDVCILCYNIANEKSLENIETKWVLEVKDYCPERPYILVGTKGDLCGELKRRENIILETEDTNELAQKISASNHIICSSMKMVCQLTLFASLLSFYHLSFRFTINNN